MTWTFVWMNTIQERVWSADPVAAWTAITVAFIDAASEAHVQVTSEPFVQVGEDSALPDGLLKVVVSASVRAVPSRIDATAPVRPCEDCLSTALGGGRWCLRCFQKHSNPKPNPTYHPSCGSDRGYHRHWRAKEQACEACKAAHAVVTSGKRRSA